MPKFLIFCFLFCLFLPLEGKVTQKVALLFLMEQDHNHREIWKKLLHLQSHHYNLYVHPKHTPQDPFFRSFAGGKRVKTSWMKHMKAWRRLLHRALQDPENCKFVFLSESCVPLRPLDEIYRLLVSNDASYINYFTPWWPPTDAREVVLLPKENRWVNSEWIILNRKHAILMVQDNSVLKNVEHFPHSCEAYPACLLSYYGHLQKEDVINKPTTHVDFLRGVESHPYMFQEATSFNIQELCKARADGLLFARKIAREFPQDVLLQIIYDKTSK